MNDFKPLRQEDKIREPFDPDSEAEEPERVLDIPVDSWDAYRNWCEKVRDCWEES